uniref:Uncharacterized protein n=1 Tax=Aegilops tauschii subsp. strangulata TaxID=200361 RepID=A0A452ZNB4_AEGTS
SSGRQPLRSANSVPSGPPRPNRPKLNPRLLPPHRSRRGRCRSPSRSPRAASCRR